MPAQVFISYAAYDAFEASLLQYVIEAALGADRVTAWTYQRDQARSERGIAAALKERVKGSIATIFLLSPSTLEGGATQWMELAYADAFDVKTFVLLHHIDYVELKAMTRGVPPLLLASQSSPASDWPIIVSDLARLLEGHPR